MIKCSECGQPILSKISPKITDEEKEIIMDCLEKWMKAMRDKYDELWFGKFGRK